ncbi:MAG: hypothetical protein JO090_02790, partial [Rhizobacter sp.]|nr:hypothetical protein [Rhizobacter sp.]
MDALAVPNEPAERAKTRRLHADLRLAGWVLLLCVWDAGMSALFVIAQSSAGVHNVQVWQICLLSVLCVVPGVVVARLAFPGLPTTPRRCVQLVVAFVVGSAIGDAIGFLAIPFSPGGDPARSVRLFAYNLGTYAVMAACIVA